MTKMRQFFSGHSVGLFCGAIFAGGMLFVFYPALPKYAALASPDSGPFFGFAYRTGLVDRMLSCGSFTPQMLYWMFLHPLFSHELTYVADTLLLVLAGVYYLRGRRVHPLAAWFGGLALGLCGYTFTLFCAGHRGYFHMVACAVWAFGLLIRCFEKQRVFYFASLGLVFAWGALYQPDVLILIGALAAAYALWLTGHSRLAHGESTVAGISVRHACVVFWRTALAVWPRFGISVAILVLAGFGAIRTAVTTQMKSRDEQIAGTATPAIQADANSESRAAQEAHNRWIFATNWSLPPEDVLEFIVPGVFGNDSMQMPYPYWGRLGRPHEAQFKKGSMLPNYRQHTVYLGLISVLFALLAVTGGWCSRGSTHSEELVSGANARLRHAVSDMPFWCGVWVVCLLLAMGRYTPVYRLFYSIPYMDYIRAPVKFLHLVEIATAFLAGFGMDAFLKDKDGTVRRRLMWLSFGAMGLFVVGALIAVVARPSCITHISALGLGPVAESLGMYTVRNVLRSAGLAALLGGVVLLSVRCGGQFTRLLGGLCVVVLVADMASVAYRYVHVIDVAPFYRENAVVRAIRKEVGPRFVNVVNYATQNAVAQDWFSTALDAHAIRNWAPRADDRGQPYGYIFSALQNDPPRLWKLCGAEYVIGPRKACEAWVRSGVMVPVLDFEVGAGSVRPVAPSEKSLMVAAIRGVSAGPRLVTEWVGDIPVEQQAERVATSTLDVSDAVAPVSIRSGDNMSARVEVLVSRGMPGSFATRVRVFSAGGGLLIFDERMTDKLEVVVDGIPAKLYTAGAVWPAVLVPAGKSEVILQMKKEYALFYLGTGVTLVVMLLGFLKGMRRRAVGVGVAA